MKNGGAQEGEEKTQTQRSRPSTHISDKFPVPTDYGRWKEATQGIKTEILNAFHFMLQNEAAI